MDINIGHGRQQFPVQTILQSGCHASAIHGSKVLINRSDRSTFAINSLLGIPDWQDSSRMDASASRYDGINTHSPFSRNFSQHASPISIQPSFLLDSLKQTVFPHDHLTNFSDISSWFTNWKCSYRLPFYEEQLVANQMMQSTCSLPTEPLSDCSQLYRRCLLPIVRSPAPTQSHDIHSRDFGED